MNKIKLIAAMAFLLFYSFASMATVLKYNVNGSSSWVPYYIPDAADNSGILGELVPLILSTAKIKIEKHNYPPRRTNQALKTGLLDFDFVSPSWFPEGEMGKEFIRSSPILSIQENIITLEENQSQWADVDKITGESIGTVRGYLYHDDDVFTRVDFASEKQLIKALHKDRVKAAISGDLPALYWAKQLKMPIALAAVHSSGVLVMRLRKEHSSVMPRINMAIAQLQNDGTIQAIVDKYTKNEQYQQ
ncbi:transporter substrate-binding domain-containing protein [Shewanella sp. 10N.7]|nr:transporter substrate-binding domain-containing protein [Shewanella sp. 10N.7]MCC4833757.1 transporter substrate-binding domain-containing protein [Shewanella sp. 10N.7]